MDVVGDEGGIVSLTHGCNWESRNCGSKAALLGSDKLLIVIDLVVLTAVGSPLLQAELVTDGVHCVPLPLTEGGAIREAEIPVSYSLVRSSVKKEPSDQDLSEDKIKGRFCIQQKDEEWFRETEGVVDGQGD